jgi:hypothetical protein
LQGAFYKVLVIRRWYPWKAQGSQVLIKRKKFKKTISQNDDQNGKNTILFPDWKLINAQNGL